MHKLAKMIIRILAEEKFYFLWKAYFEGFLEITAHLGAFVPALYAPSYA